MTDSGRYATGSNTCSLTSASVTVAWAVGRLITASVGVALVSQIITAIALWRLVPYLDALRAGA